MRCARTILLLFCRACGTQTPGFYLFHWMKMSHDGAMATINHICQFSSTLTWIIVDCVWTIFIKPRRSSWTWSVTNVKRSSLKRKKPFSCRALSDGIVPIHGANVSGRLLCFRPSIEFKEKNMWEMFQFLHFALHFLVFTAPVTIFNMLTQAQELKFK